MHAIQVLAVLARLVAVAPVGNAALFGVVLLRTAGWLGPVAPRCMPGGSAYAGR